MAELAGTPRVMRLLPRPRRIPVWIILLPLLIGICAAGAYLLRDRIVPLFAGSPARSQTVSGLDLRDIEELVATTGEHRYILTEDEVQRSFRKAKQYFSEYRDNLALREINRLLGSNASVPVQEQARAVKNFIPAPDFTTVRDSFEYDEVADDPFLHDHCYVVWSGKISNLLITESEIRFDFLVGYEENKVLEGIVPVVLDFAAVLEQGMPLEILAEVVADEDTFDLRGLSIHKLRPR